MSEPQSEYLTVAQAAARLGLKERTVQKYCAAGKLAARRVSTPTGDAWQIDRVEFDASEAINKAPTERTNAQRTTERTAPAPRAQNESPISKSSERTANDRTHSGERTSDAAENVSAMLAQSREEIHFLRGLVEQRDRDAAELRAALRKALDAMPKALTSGSTPAGENATRDNEPQAPQTAHSNQTKVATAHRQKLTPWQRAAARILGIRK
jgi:excisionase family DNA binding protein